MPFTTNLLWQNDDRWAADKLGYGPQTIKDWGCLATALTMALNGCGYNETPATVNKKMVAAGAFSGAAINAYRLGEVFPALALKEMVDCEKSDAPLSRIDAEIAANKPVLVRVDWNAAPGIQDHWVLLVGKSGGDYLMYDPWRYKGDEPGKPIALTSRYKYSGQTTADAITSVIFFDVRGKKAASTTGTPAVTPAASGPASNVPAPAAVTKKPVPAGAVVLMPTAGDVAFRGAPDMSAPLLRRLPAGEVLQSLEARAATLGKVGVQGQWINVQARAGDQGFVAAWFVSAAEVFGPSMGMPNEAADVPAVAPTAAEPAPAALTVKAAQDQLAFRSQPLIADSTLIARLPIGTLLTVIDPAAGQKIGVEGQWLKVKDASGREGYVAAWFVSR